MNRAELDTYSTVTDAEIVTRVRGGQPYLFEVIMRRHNQRIYRAARAILGDPNEAEDVMQQSYVSSYEHLAQFEGRASFATWLTRIAVNEAIARLRQRRRYEPIESTSTPETEPMCMPASASPEQDSSDRELCALIEKAVDSLPVDFRATFVLRAVEGLSGAEAAECLGVSEETIKTRLHRARIRIQKALLESAGPRISQTFEFHLSRCDRVVDGVLERILGPSGRLASGK